MTNIIETSLDNEITVLGAFLNSSENAKIGLKLVHEDDFFDPKHKLIFKAIREVFFEKKVVDVELTRDKLDVGGELDNVGGVSYLVTLS